ncbi:uncharacterized protein DSM5745_00312 [Aspergillus mulundensis]|uniref:Uncharacterized protein n=1 Tax=Aspergillus mulundensis TaxID=1810919 RepID=A0A3D8T381_9EURO|nr:hypothetical protein DSM5745_00312 [Aspergillus mulundensis]RDW92990.1 hypothetical protein DSM5745_00312 [Aspergillus mulundensis]
MYCNPYGNPRHQKNNSSVPEIPQGRAVVNGNNLFNWFDSESDSDDAYVRPEATGQDTDDWATATDDEMRSILLDIETEASAQLPTTAVEDES